MTIVTYHHRAKRARRKNPDRPFPLGRIVIARPPRKKHYGEIREAVPDNAERTRLPSWRSISHEWEVPELSYCITVKMKAVLMPNNSIPSAASRAPSICQSGSGVTPQAPRVAIRSTE